MSNCPTCGGTNEDDARFCVHCGARVGARAAAAPPPAAEKARESKRPPASKRRTSRRPPKKPKRQATLVDTSTGAAQAAAAPPAPPAHSMSEALEGALAAVGAPAPGADTPAPAPAAQPSPPPPAQSPAAAGQGVPLEQVLAGLDDGFDSIATHEGPAVSGRQRAEDLTEPQALFGKIAATHMRPVRDFVIEVRMGEPPTDWIQLCLPATDSLRKSAEELSLGKLCSALGEFIAALKMAGDTGDRFITGASRNAITKAYAGLEKLMPEGFALDEERDRREPIIVQTLLSQVEGVRAVALDKIYAAGLTSLSMFYAAKPQDLAAATGIAPDLSARIADRFASYREHTAGVAPDAERSREQIQLAELLATLKQQHEAFEDAGGGSEKRRLRRRRADTVLKLTLLLARLGEVERLEKLERLPFERKLEELELTVEQLKTKHAQLA